MPYDFSTFDRNCSVEQVTPLAGSVTGTIPPWLKGSLIMNGPGKMKFGDQEYQHAFDGMAVLQKVTFAETGPVYTRKFLKSKAFQINSENDQIVVSEFATKGTSTNNKSALKKLGDKFSIKLFSDNAAINIVKYGSHLYAVTESPFLHRIDPESLDTLGKVDLNKELGVNSQCPHPIATKDGTSINLLYNFGATGPRYEIYRFPAESCGDSFPKPTKLGSVDARWKLNPCHMHSFGLTENYVILAEQPLTIDVKSMVANTVREKPFIDGMEWINDKLVKFHVVSLATGKELKFRMKSEPFFYLHIINSYEEDNHIVMDICTSKRPDILFSFYLKNLRENGENLWKELDNGEVKRIVLPLVTNDKATPEENLISLNGSKATAFRQKDGVLLLTAETITPICYENPTINPAFNSKKNTYFYGASSDMTETCGKVGKVNVKTGEVKTWSQDNTYTCVLSFVPRPGSSPDAEEDGVVLVSCIHGGSEKSKLSVAVLDAASMEELAMVSFNPPADTPRALHGLFHI